MYTYISVCVSQDDSSKSLLLVDGSWLFLLGVNRFHCFRSFGFNHVALGSVVQFFVLLISVYVSQCACHFVTETFRAAFGKRRFDRFFGGAFQILTIGITAITFDTVLVNVRVSVREPIIKGVRGFIDDRILDSLIDLGNKVKKGEGSRQHQIRRKVHPLDRIVVAAFGGTIFKRGSVPCFKSCRKLMDDTKYSKDRCNECPE